MSSMTKAQALVAFALEMGDNALILGHRISEWTGRGPVLEQDMAMTNIALDLVGASRLWLSMAGEWEGRGRGEDELAYHRDGWDFKNVLLTEQPNGDFAHTIVRHFLYDAYNFYFHKALSDSPEPRIAAIAQKSFKEVTYHLRFSSEWMLRLGNGTDESHRRLQQAVNILWPFHGELLQPSEEGKWLANAGIIPDLEDIRPAIEAKIKEILLEANMAIPENTWMQSGGKMGRHTEHLGYILTELQFVQRAYPGMTW